MIHTTCITHRRPPNPVTQMHIIHHHMDNMVTPGCLLLSSSGKSLIVHSLAPTLSFRTTSRACWRLSMMLLDGRGYVSASTFKSLVNSLCRNTKLSIQCFHGWLEITSLSKGRLHPSNAHSPVVVLQAQSTETTSTERYLKACSFLRVCIVDELESRSVGTTTQNQLSMSATSSRGCEVSRGIAQVSAGDQTSRACPTRS